MAGAYTQVSHSVAVFQLYKLKDSMNSEGKGDNMEHEEKLDSVQLEYLYLLQSQLASQKIHFEGIIDRLEQQHRQEVLNLKNLHLIKLAL